eukprot:CAMPEP_0201701442 /NCGR_PEP_ID=MMETSP0578-20130828/32660_1 /ASSEMBLY_ACC=CAM_ASM_000663 /TAXON_ID=267565 /ORGANISM="Skeletonema grethea, Strain CCMP 1804" /LENGTH=35 /DNA_ID= /DNA_START= /DNA_END= /DNA_ORIENTATION=
MTLTLPVAVPGDTAAPRSVPSSTSSWFGASGLRIL